MRLTPLILFCLFTIPTSARADVEIPVEAPATEIVEYEELWRTDPYSDDYLMGNPASVTFDDDGNVYILDTQQQEVFKFTAAGEFVGTVARRGEAPGEINQVFSVHWWGPDSLLLPQAFPPRLVRVGADGTPQDDYRVYLDKDDDMAASITNIQPSGEFAVVGGASFTFMGNEASTTSWVGIADREGNLRTKLGERTMPMSTNPMKQSFDEEEQFWEWDRWTVSPAGLVYRAPAREEYTIEVYDLDGNLLDTWRRDIPARKRGKEETENMTGGMTFVFNNEKADIESTFSDYQPQIGQLSFHGGHLWVQQDRRPGETEGYAHQAVITPQGTLVKEQTLMVPFDGKNDIVHTIDAEHVVVLKNAIGAISAQFSQMTGDDVDEELSGDPVEVIVYRAQSAAP